MGIHNQKDKVILLLGSSGATKRYLPIAEHDTLQRHSCLRRLVEDSDCDHDLNKITKRHDAYGIQFPKLGCMLRPAQEEKTKDAGVFLFLKQSIHDGPDGNEIHQIQ